MAFSPRFARQLELLKSSASCWIPPEGKSASCATFHAAISVCCYFQLSQELKRRTRVAALFLNEASLLRLISALLCEQSDEWLTSKIYLNMNAARPPHA